MPLTIYNTLTRKKEEFKPLDENGKHVGVYVCGPTVYGDSHIGHAKSYVSFDIIIRYLRYLNYNVTYVQNITDVGHLLGETNEGEDRMLKQSRIEKKHPMEIAEYYTRSYFEDMDTLNVVRPDISPRATGHIIEQIEIVQTLIKKGFAYESNGSVYFDVSKFSEYGKLSNRTIEESETGTRVETRSEKKFPNDFALWKRAEPEHIMQWSSPWGKGFPGWHVECSAMSMKYLGETFDIHGGGMDNQFPHHECEIAQSECANGKPFVKYFLHNNLVTVNGQKMSKSLGNFTTLKDLFKKFDPIVLRFFILQSHYRSTLDFSEEAISSSAKGYEKLLNTVKKVREGLGLEGGGLGKEERKPQTTNHKPFEITNYKLQFMEAMNDDFNTPQVIAMLFDFSREVNTLLASGNVSKEQLQEIDLFFSEVGGNVLGIIPKENENKTTSILKEDKVMKVFIKLREKLKSEKLWLFSDLIRKELNDELNITLEDGKEGTTWKKK
ncbi:MAG: cysteine--tRNA ligase [Ignavibacteriales bacterium]|nr:cysteine--tRNA ligase [Ignavibacteriales bacterium]